MVISFLYYVVGDSLRLVLFPLVMLICFLSLGNINAVDSFLRSKWIIYFIVMFFGVVLIQVTSGNFTPFVLYILAAPVMAHFFINKVFDTKKIKIPFYLAIAFMAVHFARFRTMEGIFSEMSPNYVSVVLIMNASVLAIVQYRQREKVRIVPAILTVLFSILAFGRSGIGCSLVLLAAVFLINWSAMTKVKKYLVLASFIIPFIVVVIAQGQYLLNMIYGISFFKKFSDNGLDSPARDILMREYFVHLNKNDLFYYIGYNYGKNPWFLHYGLNPHNSYIRLHHYFGVFFFLIVPTLIISFLKLLYSNRFYALILLAILLRAYTDTVLFLSLYDFLVISLIFMTFKKKKMMHPAIEINDI